MVIVKNRPITGREYKIMLKADKFKNREKGIAEFKEIIKNQIELINSKGKIKPIIFDNKNNNKGIKERLVWYLDTPDFQIKEYKFLLRIRKEKNKDDDDDGLVGDNIKYIIDLKCRNPDRYISSSYNLTPTLIEDIKKNRIGFEFEEDIVPKLENLNPLKPDFASKFSHSVSFKKSKEPELVSFGDLLSIFPGLSVLDIEPNVELKKVNDFVAKEISVNIGKIKFVNKDVGTNDLCINFWYLPDDDDKEETNPLIIEFSFDYHAKDKKNKLKGSSNDKILEEFRISLVRKINDFYIGLFKQKDFVDLKTSKTKTEFAYEWKQK